MLKQDRNNSYTLFFNSFYKTELPEFHYINAKIKITRWPNKILNLLLKFKLLTLEKLIGDFDVLYMPNLNQFNISKKAKLFLTVHDLSPVVTPEFYDIKRQLWHKFLNYKKAFKRADAIFAVSEYTKSDLTKLFSIPEEKIHVVYPGVDKKIFNPEIPLDTLRQIRNKYGLPGDYILFLNTIEPRKNLLGLIAAFEIMLNNQATANLIRRSQVGQIMSIIQTSSKDGMIPMNKSIDQLVERSLVEPSTAETRKRNLETQASYY
jgi:glycosyltransferase involved in cell wall biosynthesis